MVLCYAEKSNIGFEYLRSRGLTRATIKEFNLLYYNGDILLGFPETLRQPWVHTLQRTLTQPYYNHRFDYTIVIPVFDMYNRYVSIMVRQLTDKEPKFDGIPYIKTQHVFGLYKTYESILHKKEVYITEGVFDFLMLWQSGIHQCVAANGCSLSLTQISLCARFTKQFNVVFDPDTAGDTGTIKTKNILEKWGYACKSIRLDDSCDLDEYIIKHGVQRFLKL